MKIEICSLYRFKAKCHSNPYIESITALSDKNAIIIIIII